MICRTLPPTTAPPVTNPPPTIITTGPQEVTTPGSGDCKPCIPCNPCMIWWMCMPCMPCIGGCGGGCSGGGCNTQTTAALPPADEPMDNNTCPCICAPCQPVSFLIIALPFQ